MEQEVIKDVARRIAKTMTYTRTAEIQAAAMRELGYSPARIRKEAMKILRADKKYREAVAKNTLEYKKEVKELINDITKQAFEEGNMLVASAGLMAWIDDMRVWKSAGKSLQGRSFLSQMVDSINLQTKGEFKNLTQTTAFKTMSGMESIKNLYQNELDKATIKICSGTFSQEQVVKECIHSLAQSGLRTVNFDSGRTMQLDTAAKLAIRTGCHQLASKILNKNMELTGCNLVYISEHEGARNKGEGIANHEEWQGKVYYVKPGKDYKDEAERVGQDSIEDLWEKTGYSADGAHESDPRGLHGYNCRHSSSVWFEGVSQKPAPIKKPEPITYEGVTYDRYAVTQKMRSMERGIRALKREKAALTSLGMDTKELDVKIKEQIRRYGRFCDAAKVPHSKANIRYDGSSSDLTKTKAYKRYHQMVEDSISDGEEIAKIEQINIAENIESTNEMVYNGGIPRKWKQIETDDDAVRNANPYRYDRNKEGYDKNCPNCVCAYEMRKRGYDVIARPATKNHYLQRYPETAWVEPEIIHTHGNGYDDILRIMNAEAAGARFEIAVIYKNVETKGHVFVSEIIEGKVVFLDPQNGTEITKKFFEYVKDNETRIWRIDNLEVSDRGITACESR